MSLKIIQLIPNRQFIDPEFSGYKLSLDVVPTIEKTLEISVDRLLPDSNQYSFLHAKLFGLHNHLIGETIDEMEIVYYIDELWCIKKVFIDNSEIQIVDVLKNTKSTKITTTQYNVSLKLVNETKAIFSDGAGRIHIIDTGPREQNNDWECVAVIDGLSQHRAFIIQDARFQKLAHSEQIHCLFFCIEQDKNEQKVSAVLYWVIFSNLGNVWTKIHTKKLYGSHNGTIHYAYIEPSCEALYVISDGTVCFAQDDNTATVIQSPDSSEKRYCWSQTDDDVTIKLKIPDNFNMDRLCINIRSTEISVSLDAQSILSGQLSHRIDSNLSNWSVENENLEIKISKQEKHLWTTLLLGDYSAEDVPNLTSARETNQKLPNLCSENEVSAPSGITFNSQQVEECDFENDKYTVFQRLSQLTSDTTHKVNVDTQTLVLTVNMNSNLPPAIAFRHDVDAYIWQPVVEAGEFRLKHEGTLNALGYVQASKTQRKFTVCAPDLSYCAICETFRHVFIYRQEKAINGGELRHRVSGKRIGHVAQQQVISLPGDEILGIHAAESKLFLLTAKSIFILSL